MPAKPDQHDNRERHAQHAASCASTSWSRTALQVVASTARASLGRVAETVAAVALGVCRMANEVGGLAASEVAVVAATTVGKGKLAVWADSVEAVKRAPEATVAVVLVVAAWSVEGSRVGLTVAVAAVSEVAPRVEEPLEALAETLVGVVRVRRQSL